MLTQLRRPKRKPIDTRGMTIITSGHGVKRHNPRRCIECHQPIRRGELWRTISSPQDNHKRRTTVIVHRLCPSPKARRQKRC